MTALFRLGGHSSVGGISSNTNSLEQYLEVLTATVAVFLVCFEEFALRYGSIVIIFFQAHEKIDDSSIESFFCIA